jgi:LysR family transcriptional activator of nhaA
MNLPNKLAVDSLNYHHLMYFWIVAREGSVSKATKVLHLAQPTISAQIRALERTLGFSLFNKEGRGLVMTERGQAVYRYADEIFSLGREMLQNVRGSQAPSPRFSVGISDSLPKLTTYRLLEPALHLQPAHQLYLRIDKTERLLADLSIQLLDIVITDAPMTHTVKIRAFNHLLGDSSVTVFGTRQLAEQHGHDFPRSLHGAPLILQTLNCALRQSLEQWFNDEQIEPQIVAEVEDVAMLQTLGQHGLGLFAAPTVVAERVCSQYDVVALGELPHVREQFYAISIDRRLQHPAVVAISQGARERLFAKAAN